MRDADLERILAANELLVPTQAFTASVMSAVGREVATPAPLGFPWRRALPGAAALAVAISAGLLVESPPNAIASQLPALRLGLRIGSIGRDALSSIGADWIALALVVTLASTQLSKRLARDWL
jgi:hypothetical protein